MMPNRFWLGYVSLALQWPFNASTGVSELDDDSLLVVLLILSESCSDVLLLLSVALC